MVRAELQPSFNGGELSARMEGRSDLATYGVAARELLNMVLTVQGPAVKRSGTEHVVPVKAAADRVRLIPFQFNVTQAYVIEAGPGYFRFFTNDVRIETAPGVAYEIATPYLAADLPLLSWEQSADVLYLFCQNHAPRELRRISALTFALVVQPVKKGPFKDQNSDDARTIGASATTGSVTLTANTATFLDGHVGSFIELEAQDFRSIPAWEPQVKVVVGDKRRSEGKVYQAIALPASGGQRTGTIQPTHVEGQERDGMDAGQDINGKDAGGVLWEYLYSRAGIVQVTAVGSSTTATATVIDRLPDELVTRPTRRWALGWMNDVEGWPVSGRVRDERLILGKGYEFVGSVVGDFNDMSTKDETGTVQADLGFRRRTPSPNVIRWLANDRELLIGTAAGEYAVGPVNPGLALSAANIKVQAQSFYGSEPVQPLQAGQRTLFVARTGRKVREAGFDFNSDRYVSPDLTVKASHITRPGVVEMAWQAEPEALAWMLRGDGKLACLTYSEEQDVRGWSSHALAGDGFVESICCIPAPDNSHDQLWLAVKRTIGGQVVRHIERLRPYWAEGQAVETGFFVDDGVEQVTGSPVATVTGLGHLVGETVAVLADGSAHPDCVVGPGGTIALQRSAMRVQAGLLYPARFTSLQLNVENQLGSAQSRLKRVVKLGLRLLETLGIRQGAPKGRMDDLNFRTSAMQMNSPVDLFSGDYPVGFPGGWERDARVTVESFQPLPFTLLSLSVRAEVGNE